MTINPDKKSADEDRDIEARTQSKQPKFWIKIIKNLNLY